MLPKVSARYGQNMLFSVCVLKLDICNKNNAVWFFHFVFTGIKALILYLKKSKYLYSAHCNDQSCSVLCVREALSANFAAGFSVAILAVYLMQMSRPYDIFTYTMTWRWRRSVSCLFGSVCSASWTRWAATQAGTRAPATVGVAVVRMTSTSITLCTVSGVWAGHFSCVWHCRMSC